MQVKVYVHAYTVSTIYVYIVLLPIGRATNLSGKGTDYLIPMLQC